jgi:hypothetical protein
MQTAFQLLSRLLTLRQGNNTYDQIISKIFPCL